MSPAAGDPAARLKVAGHGKPGASNAKDRLRHATRVAVLPVATGIGGGVAVVVTPAAGHPSRRLKVEAVGLEVAAEDAVAPQDTALPCRAVVVHGGRDIEEERHRQRRSLCAVPALGGRAALRQAR